MKLTLCICAVALASLASASASAATLRQLINETQRTHLEQTSSSLVWWIPQQFWRAFFANNPSIPEKSLSDWEAIHRPYLILIVHYSDVGPSGEIRSAALERLLPTIRLIGTGGKEQRPLDPQKVTPEAVDLIASVIPHFAKQMGDVGRNLQFVFFAATDPAGAQVADPLKAGKLVVRMMDQTYSFRLPLGSLLPKKRCPVDGEVLNGAWQFCPWHGKKLPEGS